MSDHDHERGTVPNGSAEKAEAESDRQSVQALSLRTISARSRVSGEIVMMATPQVSDRQVSPPGP